MLIRRKFEYRSTKFEIIPNDKNSKDQNASQIRLLQKSGSTCMFGTFRHSNFEFVSDFDIRISSLLSSQIALKRYNPFNSHQQNRWINEDLKTTLCHGCTNHSKTKQTNQYLSSFKPRLCNSLLLRLENPCCSACFPILLLDIFMNMPPSQNRSNCAFRCGFLRLATDSTAQSVLKFI